MDNEKEIVKKFRITTNGKGLDDSLEFAKGKNVLCEFKYIKTYGLIRQQHEIDVTLSGKECDVEYIKKFIDLNVEISKYYV